MTATLAMELSPASASPRRRLLLRVYLFLALASVAVPAILVRLPPLLDYPNHYVRIWLLSGGLKQAPLSSMYAANWGMARTNVGLDLATQFLGPLMPVWVLAPLFLVLALVLPPLGAVLLHRRVFKTESWWTLGFPMAAWSTTLIAGFVNYHIGLGMALVAAAADPWMKARLTPLQLLVARASIAAALLIVHIFALGFYGAILAGLAVGPRLLDMLDFKRFRQAAISVVAAAAAVILPLVIFSLTTPKLPGGGSWAPIWGPTTFNYKIDLLSSAIGTYDPLIDCLFFAPPAIMIAVGLMLGRLRAHQGLLVSAAGLFFLSLIAPTWAAETGFIDTRMPIMGLLVLLAALEPLPSDDASRAGWVRRAGGVFALALVALSLGRSAWIGDIWVKRDADLKSVEAALEHVPAGAAVLPVEHKPSIRGLREEPIGRYPHFGVSYLHMYTLSVMQRRAFSPLVFAQPGKQPLQVLPPWNEIAAPNGGRAPSFRVLNNPSRIWKSYAPYIRDWRNRFDYALMLNCDVPADVRLEPIPPGVTLVADEGFARLYKISRLPPPAADPESGPGA